MGTYFFVELLGEKMATLGDKVKQIWVDYIAPTQSKAEPSNNKSRKLKPTSNYDPELKREGFKELNPRKRREIANHSPLLMKGVRKKSLDTFRSWFSLNTLDGRGKPIKSDLQLLHDFEVRSNLRHKFFEARVASHIYGDGFLLITFTKDDDTTLSDPVAPDAEPWNIKVINSEYITEKAYPNKKSMKEGLLYYHYKKGMEDYYIHPDRVIHIPANKIPGMALGVSTIDLLRYVIYSKKNIDIAAGYILSWFSRGMVDIEVMDADKDELKDWEEVARQHPTFWVHNQETKIDFKKPEAIDPKPFYDYVVLNIASALNMPYHILTGIQVGRVEGSEIGFADYYRDVRDDQELVFTPLLRKLYTKILEANGKQWKYKISWNPIYIDEMTEAKLLEIRVNAASKAFNGSKNGIGFIDMEEARRIFNEGQIEVDTKKQIEPLKSPQVSQKDEAPEDDDTEEEMQGPPENPHKRPTRPLTDENREMIRKWKEKRKKELDELEDELFDDEN